MDDKRQSPTVLVLEGEALIAFDIQATLEAAGYTPRLVFGVHEARDQILADQPDMAIVNVISDGGDSAPIAELLLAAGVPFAVHSGASIGSPLAMAFQWVNPAFAGP